MQRQIVDGVGNSLPVERRFQIQIDRLPALLDDVSERSLPNLARTEQRHCRGVGDTILD